MSGNKNRANKPRRALPKKSVAVRPARPRQPKKIGQPLIPKGTLSGIGKALGSNFGPMGAMIGGKAGALMAQVTGFGDYQLDNNTIMTGGLTPPQIVNSVNNGGTIVRHREYIGDVFGSTTSFVNSTFPLNPGNFSTFPWLSQMALAFEEYEFRGLMFEFKSLSSDAVLSTAASTALGYVAMATQYNSASAPFADKKALENYEFSNSNKPSCTFIHPIECKRSLNVDTHLYIRTGSVPVGQDQKLYDLGTLNVAVGGMQNNGGIIGELWATYEIELYHPKYTINAGAVSDHFTGNTPNSVAPFGLSQNPSTGNNLGMVFKTNFTLAFPSYYTDGEYLVSITWSGPVSTTAAYPVFTFVGCQLLTILSNNVNTVLLCPPAGQTSTSMSWLGVVKIQQSNSTISLSGAGNFPTGASTVDVIVTEYASLS